MRDAVGHHIALGHRHIAHITYAAADYRGAEDGLAVYRRTLRDAGLPVDVRLVRHGALSAESGFGAVTSLLEAGRSFSALFAGNDTVALGALAALRGTGLRVPEDVAVVGYDDIPAAAYAAPPLTTVRTDPREQGGRAGALLIPLVRGERPEHRRVQLDSAALVVRGLRRAPGRTRRDLALSAVRLREGAERSARSCGGVVEQREPARAPTRSSPHPPTGGEVG